MNKPGWWARTVPRATVLIWFGRLILINAQLLRMFGKEKEAKTCANGVINMLKRQGVYI